MSRKLLLLCCAVVCALSTPGWADEQPPQPPAEDAGDQPLQLHVPLYREVTIDAQADDWAGRSHATTELSASAAVELEDGDLSGDLHLGWDEQGLALLLVVRDDLAVESEHELSVTEMDSVELLVSDESTDGSKVRFALSPGKVETANGPLLRTWDYRQQAELRRTPIELELARRATEDGYIVEMRIPWAALGIDPRAGVAVGFALEVHDADGGFRRDHVTFGPPDAKRSQGDPPVINRLILAAMRHELARTTAPKPSA